MIQRWGETAGPPPPVAYRDHYQRLERPIEVPVGIGSNMADVAIATHFSVRRRRGFFVLACLAGSIGLFISILNSPWRNEFLAPGSLTQVHAQILKREGVQRCAACHGAASASFSDWVLDMFQGGKHLKVSQTHLCLACHGEAVGDAAVETEPHNLAKEELSRRTKAVNRRVVAGFATFVHASSDGNDAIACAVCHREHHGAMIDLTRIDDAKCQSCHVRSFDRFENEHPDFQLASRSTSDRAIGFDHASHAAMHFLEKNRAFDCRACHLPDGAGRNFDRVSFEVGCASCHEIALQASMGSGIAFLSLPSIDMDALNARGAAIRYWPRLLSREFDGRIGPWMALLLSTDATIAPSIADRKMNLDFFDLDPGDASDMAFATGVVAAIERLARDLKAEGRDAIRRRIGQVTGETQAEDAAERLLVGLEDSMLREFAEYVLGDSGSTTSLLDAESMLIRQNQFSLRFDEELIPNPLKAMMTGRGNPQQGSIPGFQSADIKSQRVGRDDPARLAQEEQSLPQANSDGEWLIANPLIALRSRVQELQTIGSQQSFHSNHQVQPEQTEIDREGTRTAPRQSDTIDRQVNDSPVQTQVETLDSTHENNRVPTKLNSGPYSNRLPATESFLRSLLEQGSGHRVSTGSWRWNSQTGTLMYHPVGHADALSKNWMDFLMATRDLPSASDALKTLSAEWLEGRTSSDCSGCHQPTREGVLGWRREVTTVNDAFFDKFAHRPHLLLADCSDCHRMEETVSRNRAVLPHRDFAAITKADCARCHREGHANSSCTHCHRYHQAANSR